MRCLLLLSIMSLLLWGEKSSSEPLTSKTVHLPHILEKQQGGDGQGDGGQSRGDGGRSGGDGWRGGGDGGRSGGDGGRGGADGGQGGGDGRRGGGDGWSGGDGGLWGGDGGLWGGDGGRGGGDGGRSGGDGGRGGRGGGDGGRSGGDGGRGGGDGGQSGGDGGRGGGDGGRGGGDGRCGGGDGGQSGGDGGRGGDDGGRVGGTDPHQRKKRSWVWNQFFVLEEFTGDEPLYVGKLHSDVDRGDGQIKYILTGEGAMSIFTIDERTGDIHAIKRLDREQQAYFILRAQARDRKTDLPVEPDSQFIIKVQDINDNEPKFLHGLYSARVPERSPVGTSVVTVVATDDDDPTYGNSARVVYSLLQGAPFFTVEPHTGVVRTALPDMDRERRDGYLLIVQAKDMMGQLGGLTGTTSVTVTLTDVNDNPPHFPRKSYQFSVSELAGVLSVAARIRALDLDVGVNAEMDYRILDGDPQGTFQILTDPDTQEGVIVITKALDFETVSSYVLHIEASNRFVDARFQVLGPYSDVTLVRLLVENVDEPPVFSVVSQMMISEAATVGTKVGSVSARDPDKINSPVRYSIDVNSDLRRHFNIDGVSGWISTARTLDQETVEVHNLTVMATEILDLSQVGKSVVLVSVMDVNDNPPHLVVDDQTFVCEGAPLGQVIETLSAMDPDDPGNGHHFLYFLSAKDAGNLSFSLRDNQDNTASVLTRRAGFLRRDQPVHVLSVVVSDGGGHSSLSSTATLSVTVCDCDALEHRRHCSRASSPRLAGFSVVSMATVLTCILIVLCVVMVTPAAGHRGRERVMASDGEREVRENIICYDDEGGGEEDTEAFDMFALRSLNRHYPAVTPPPHLTQDGGSDRKLFQVLMWDRLQEADQNKTAPPYDSLQTYAFEGTGSTADSLSSLNSLSSSETERSYDFLKVWGPRFKKLSDLYVEHDRGRSLSNQSTESSAPSTRSLTGCSGGRWA